MIRLNRDRNRRVRNRRGPRRGVDRSRVGPSERDFFFFFTCPPDTRANPNRITDRQQSTEINRQEGMSRRKQARPSRAHLEEDLVQGPLLINPVGNVNVTRKCKHHRREIRREVKRKEKRNGKKSREKKGKRNYGCVRALSLYRARFQCSCELG